MHFLNSTKTNFDKYIFILIILIIFILLSWFDQQLKLIVSIWQKNKTLTFLINKTTFYSSWFISSPKFYKLLYLFDHKTINFYGQNHFGFSSKNSLKQIKHLLLHRRTRNVYQIKSFFIFLKTFMRTMNLDTMRKTTLARFINILIFYITIIKTIKPGFTQI